MIVSLLALLLSQAPPPASAQPAVPFLRRGLVELQRGDLPAAETDLKQASVLQPTNAFVWIALADVYLQQKDGQQAAAAAAKAEDVGSGNALVDHALAMYYGKTDQYLKAAEKEKQFSESPKGDAASRARAATWFLAAGQKDQALPLAQAAGKQDAATAFPLAELFLRAQAFTEAAQLIEEALQVHPDDPQLVLALGAARYGQRRFDEAITAFLQVAHLQPDVEQPYVFLAKMLDQAGNHLTEIATVTAAYAQSHPQDGAVQLALAKVRLAQDAACSECNALLERAVELDDKSWEAHFQLGAYLANKRRYQDASLQLKKAIELSPKQPTPHYQLARVLDRMGDSAGAAEQRTIHKQLVGSGDTK